MFSGKRLLTHKKECNNMKKEKTITLITASVLFLGACSQSDNHTTTSNHQKDSHQGTIALKKVKTKPEDAIKKAQNSYKNQQVTEISFEKSNGEWVYKVEQQNPQNHNESEVIVNDKSQRVEHKKSEKGDQDHSDDQDTFKYSEVKSYKSAIKAAQRAFDGEIKEWSLSKDDGKLVYDITLQKDKEQRDITVDAQTGKVIDNQQDD
jgi:uncharacterized membrane protein YkoI